MRLTIGEYQKAVKRTLAVLDNSTEDRMHMLLGFGSEIKELLVATDVENSAEELTDIMWYLANYCNMYNIELESYFQFNLLKSYRNITLRNGLEYDINLICVISKFQDFEKKQLAYKRMIDQERRIMLVIELAEALNDCFKLRNVDPYICMFNNIAKLKVRYPEKFTEENALNRDLDKERSTLEIN